MPASSLRPLSTILCTIHPRPKTRTFPATAGTAESAHSELATAALAADTPYDSPTLVGEDDMPIATPDNASNTPKMHAYARASAPDGVPVANANGLSRADTPQVFSSVAARQTIGDGARLPMPAPKPTRFSPLNNNHARSQSGAPPQSPPHQPGLSPPIRRARTNSNDFGVGGAATMLWEPSVLADSEFNSPSTNPERIARFQGPGNDVHPALTKSPPTWNQPQASQFSEFIIGNDGMMNVRPNAGNNRKHQQHRISQDNHEGRRSIEDPFEPHTAQTKLPLRDLHPRKPYPEHPNHPINNLVDEDEMRGAIPSKFDGARARDTKYNTPARPNPIFNNVDDDSDEFDMPSEPEQMTPRGPDKRGKALLESPLRYASPSKEDGSKKRRRQSCDYDDKALSSMDYADLRAQPFDFDPAGETSPARARATEGSNLPARLEHYKGRGEADQRAFFEGMSVAEWDGAGDWFLEEFGAVVQRMKEGRRRRRELVEGFEAEIAEREEGVRARAEGVKRKLDRMKRDGLKVVADE